MAPRWADVAGNYQLIVFAPLVIVFGRFFRDGLWGFAGQQMAMLLIEHNERRVVKLSRSVYVLSLGEITAQGPPAAFAGDLHAQVKSWLGINF